MNDRAATDGFDIMHVGRDDATHGRYGRVARVALGGALIAAGAIRRGWPRSVFFLSGGYLVLRELTRDRHGELPSRRAEAAERDAVDEASWQSFPASDPPGF